MKYKIVDYQQGSDEWKAWRRFKIGASEIAAIMGDCPYASPLDLWEKKVKGEQEQDNAAMQLGRDAEPKALAWVNNHLGTNYQPVCIESVDQPHLVLSLDGFDPNAPIPILEIKRMSKDKHEAAKRKVIPINYQWQIQDQMYVVNSDCALFCSYQNDDDVALIEAEEFAPMWQRIHDETRPFYERVLNFDPPPASEQDYQKVNDSKLLNLLCEYDSLEKSFKGAEKRMKEIREAITGDLTKYGIKRALIGSKKIACIPIKGRVDYDAIPQLQDMDLDLYRKPATSSWRFIGV